MKYNKKNIFYGKDLINFVQRCLYFRTLDIVHNHSSIKTINEHMEYALNSKV